MSKETSVAVAAGRAHESHLELLRSVEGGEVGVEGAPHATTLSESAFGSCKEPSRGVERLDPDFPGELRHEQTGVLEAVDASDDPRTWPSARASEVNERRTVATRPPARVRGRHDCCCPSDNGGSPSVRLCATVFADSVGHARHGGHA